MVTLFEVWKIQIIILRFQYSVLYKKEAAHDDSIWSCSWGRISKKESKKDHDGDNSRY